LVLLPWSVVGEKKETHAASHQSQVHGDEDNPGERRIINNSEVHIKINNCKRITLELTYFIV